MQDYHLMQSGYIMCSGLSGGWYCVRHHGLQTKGRGLTGCLASECGNSPIHCANTGKCWNSEAHLRHCEVSDEPCWIVPGHAAREAKLAACNHRIPVVKSGATDCPPGAFEIDLQRAGGVSIDVHPTYEPHRPLIFCRSTCISESQVNDMQRQSGSTEPLTVRVWLAIAAAHTQGLSSVDASGHSGHQ